MDLVLFIFSFISIFCFTLLFFILDLDKEYDIIIYHSYGYMIT